MMVLRYMSFTITLGNSYVFGTIVNADATLSDVYVVLCYVLSQYPNGANTGYEPGHFAININY
jgi:hypothetical protein